MAKQHDVMINRMLANYLEEQLHPDGLEYGGSDIAKIFGVIGLHQKDRDEILKTAHRRLKQLERISQPLGPKISLWYEELTK